MLFAALLFSMLASAQTPGASPDRAEYMRLTADMHSLARREAWAGVERTYRKVVATRVEPSFADHVAGAHAASATGDIGAARARLMAAKAQRDDREVIEWLWTIDTSFVQVDLITRPGGTLVIDAVPFDQHQAGAVRFATAQVAQTGAFHGYLPQGCYTLDGRRFVVGQGHEVALDLRTEPDVKRTFRRRVGLKRESLPQGVVSLR